MRQSRSKQSAMPSHSGPYPEKITDSIDLRSWCLFSIRQACKFEETVV